MTPLAWIAFVAAGAAGAPVRYLIDGAIGERTRGALPWGTFIINTTGSLLLGFLTGLALYLAVASTGTGQRGASRRGGPATLPDEALGSGELDWVGRRGEDAAEQLWWLG
jgi:fluoride exporter